MRILLMCLVALSLTPLVATVVAQDTKGPIGVVAQRLSALQNVKVVYTRIEKDYPEPDTLAQAEITLPNGKSAQVEFFDGSVVRQETFSFLRGKLRHESRMSEDAAKNMKSKGHAAVEDEILIITQERAERAVKHLGHERVVGAIRKSMEIPRTTVDYALGLRAPDSDEWMRPDGMPEFQSSIDENGFLVLERRGSSGQWYTWKYDPKLQYALVNFTALGPDGRIGFMISNSDFRRVAELDSPFKIRRQHFRKVEGEITRTTKEVSIDVADYKVGEKENATERYRMLWPKGSTVRDERIGETINVQSQDMVLDDEKINDVVEKYHAEKVQELKKAQERIEQIRKKDGQ